MRHDATTRNEDYPAGLNLTQEQGIYNQLWKKARDMQRGQNRPEQIAIGFKPRPVDGTIRPLNPAKPVRDLDSVMAVSMLAIPSEHWIGAPPARRYRIHTSTLTAGVSDGEIVFHLPDQEFDFGKSPLQDHPVYRVKAYDPASIGAAIEAAREEGVKDAPDHSELTAPIGGDMVTTRDDIFVKVQIGRTIVYRFGLRAAVEIRPDRFVQQGEVIAKLIETQDYQVAELRSSGRPKMDLIGPDVLSASRFNPLFRLCNRMYSGIIDMSDPENGPWPLRRASKLLPKLLAVFPLEDEGESGDWVESIRAAGVFEPSGELKKQILAAVQPGGSFCVESPVDGVFTGVDDFGAYQQANFRQENGEVAVLTLPRCAVMHARFSTGGALVSQGEVIGDWIRREYFPDYMDLGVHAETGLFAIESAYLRSQAIHAGEQGFEEDGIAIDARLVESAIEIAEGFKLDFSELLTSFHGKFYDQSTGTVGPVLMKSDHVQVNEIGIVANGLRYAPPMKSYVETPERNNASRKSNRRRQGASA